MALVVDPYTATPGATIAAAEINARIAAIIAQVNGNLDAANVKDASVTKAKLASDALQAFLQLGVAATRKLRFGLITFGAGFGGANRQTFTVPHGLGSAPVLACVFPTTVAAVSTSTGQQEVVTFGRVSEDATNLTVEGVLSNGATAAVGPGPAYWIAIG